MIVKNLEPEFGWSIVVRTGWKKNGRPYILSHIVKRTRASAIAEICSQFGMTWRQLYRRHFRAVKVKIIPIWQVRP